MENPDSGGSGSLEEMPWDGTNPSLNRFYSNTPLVKENWNKLFPYKIMVIDARTNSVIVGDRSTSQAKIKVETTSTGSEISFPTNTGRKWEYTLPISPQSLATDTTFAINLTATQQGVVEEHNGVVFKNISVSMTMGVYPSRESVESSLKPAQTGFQVVFENTIDSASRLAKSIDKVKNVFSTAAASKKPENYDPKEGQLYSTGYYQALYLQRFLEQYSLAKKDPVNQHWRLCFANFKDNEFYLVTPQRFRISRSVQNPMVYNCDLQLKAFRRIDLESEKSDKDLRFKINDPNFYQRAVNTIAAARSVMSNSVNTINAIRADFRRPFEVLRQASVLLKDAAGVIVTGADLIPSVIKDMDDQIAQAIANRADAADILRAGPSAKNLRLIKEFGSISKANGTQIGSAGSNVSTKGNPAMNPFSKPEANFDLLNMVSVQDLAPNEAIQERIDRDTENIKSLTVDQLKAHSEEIRSLVQDLANQFGAGDEVAYEILGLPKPKIRAIPLSIDELEILDSLYEVLGVYNKLTATQDLDRQRILNPIQFTKQTANEYGIEFDDAQAKVLVPVPYKLSIEEIANRYLNDPKRWIEIAALNNLRSPFIDEEGFRLKILSNGEDRRFTIEYDSRVYLGKKIFLESDTVSRFTRNIIQLDRIGETTLLVTVDGAPDMSILKTIDNAEVKMYQSGTVNSQDLIFIPIDSKTMPDDGILPPEAFRGDEAVALSKVDFLLDETGDIVMDSGGDIKLAAGMTNLIQALRTMTLTVLGSDITAKDVGIPAGVGLSVSEVQAQAIFSQIETQIDADPRFDGVEDMKVALDGPLLKVNISVREANNGGIVPISFTVKR